MILITGASGFVGKHLVEALKGRPMILVDRHHGHDLTDVNTLIPLINQKIDTVVHMASVTPANAYSKDYFRTNVTGTINLLKSLGELPSDKSGGILYPSTPRYKRHIKKIILLSSISVYKINKDADTYLREDSEITTLQESPYGYSKYLQESPIQEYCSDYSIECLIFRASSIYGHGMPTTLISAFNEKSKGNENLEITTKNYKQNFIYVGDVVELVKQARDSDVTGIYNLFSDCTLDIEQLAKTVISINNSSSEILKKYNSEDKYNKIYYNTKLHRDFNFKFIPMGE